MPPLSRRHQRAQSHRRSVLPCCVRAVIAWMSPSSPPTVVEGGHDFGARAVRSSREPRPFGARRACSSCPPAGVSARTR
eukprot:2945536-Alexandrium_andersonii.AAC.1